MGFFSAPPKHQVLEHQLRNNQLLNIKRLKHQLSDVSDNKKLIKWGDPVFLNKTCYSFVPNGGHY